ncbi:alpha-2-macroglobulin family protein [Pollutibacter soli]|uniref:alpha-2-macroglobulin family protein n=1 Tax=Pollutibacter soli TaxID=3034157 RepID=UPI003013BA1B
MREILIVTALIITQLHAFAQQKMTDYTKLWKKVDDLIEKKGLTASALTEVKNIYSLAVKEKNDAQQIRALVYEGRLTDTNEEDATQKISDRWNSLLKTSHEPVSSLLNSMLGKLYWNYFQRNRYKLYREPNTENGKLEEKKKDLESMDAEELHQLITKHFTASLKDYKTLSGIKLNQWQPIIIKGNNPELRPTLYDLLAQAALQYFVSGERTLRKAVNDFEISDTRAFGHAAQFVQWKPETKDSTSLYYQAILIYQQLIRLHLSDKNLTALLDVDIERLQFVHRIAVTPDKNEFYRAGLLSIFLNYPDRPEAGKAFYLATAQVYQEAMNYSDENPDQRLRFLLVDVKQQLEQIQKKYPLTEAAANASNLLQQILKKSVQLETERVNLPDQPFRTRVSFANTNLMYYRIIKVDDHFPDENNRWDDKYWQKLVSLKPIDQVRQELPLAPDYRTHSTEIKIDALPVGRYALLAGVNENFSLDQNPLAVQYFDVSDISWANNGNHYFFLHRDNGQPLTDAQVQLWSKKYDYKTNKYNFTKLQSLSANKNGYAFISAPEKLDGQLTFEINWQKDHLFSSDEQIRPYPIYRNATGEIPDEEKARSHAFIFLDRSIYRPGQEVFFKTIYIRKNKNENTHAVISGLRSTVYLNNANGEIIDSLQLESNEFGSVSGKFRLPLSGLTGSFSIREAYTNATQQFNVEEYKRPKFQVTLEKPKKEFKLNDTVTVEGNAVAYAGIAIGGSKVRYRVTRSVFYPYPFYSRYRIMPYSEPVEIANGITETGVDGKFNISFPAVPDKNSDPKSLPVFHYSISADVTDINGETRSAETMVSIGYHSLQISGSVAEVLYADSTNKISVSATNLSGEPQKATVKITAYLLETPDRLIRERYWNQSDTFIFSNEEYIKYFPNDEYADESKKESWKRKAKVWEITDTVSGNNQSVTIPKSALKPGVYAIEISGTDKSGREVKTVVYTELKASINSKSMVPSYYQAAVNKNTFEPGEIARLHQQTDADQLFIIRQLISATESEQYYFNRENRDFVYDIQRLNKESKNTDYPVVEKDRGGFGISHVFVKHNRLFIDESVIAVPWTNKELDFRFTTFRDKTLPGSKEEWAVQVSGWKGEKLAAEILTSMYDASLDQFMVHNWYKPAIFSTFHRQAGLWSKNSYFAVSHGDIRYINEKTTEINSAIPDELLWVKDELVNVGYAMQRMAKGVVVKDEAVLQEMAPPQAMNSLADTVAVPDLEKDPTGSKGLMKTIIVRKEGSEQPANENQPTKMRTDFRETAFFFPDLKTDANGNVNFSFTMPEALTEWKWQVFAHTKDLAMGLGTKTVITQKELMVQPNLPRFLREGDKLTVAVKVVNLTDVEMTGQSVLQLIDAASGQVVDGLFTNVFPTQYFTAPAKGSVPVEFTMTMPYSFNRPLICRITAKAGNHTDGEEIALPVLTNRMLITESLPVRMTGTGTKTFSFEKLLQSGKSPSLSNHGITVEYSSNPAWYAVQALPYLTQYPYACAEQEFNRFYANTLASMIASKHPKIKAWFEKRMQDSAKGKPVQLISNLEKNPELKNILLEETPWVLDAESETAQQKQIATLFDMIRISADLQASLAKLAQSQTSNGGFVWFPGGPEDRYITQYIITGIGRLKKLGAIPAAQQSTVTEIASKGLKYLAQQIRKDYDEVQKNNKKVAAYVPGDLSIQYLYAISFFPEFKADTKTATAIQYFRSQAKKNWVKKDRQTQAMLALSAHRAKDATLAKSTLKALKEQSVNSETLGRYWKAPQYGYYWYQAPIETQALMIEAFDEINADALMVSGLKQWLLLQKQTQNWSTTKATADACYALLLRGSDWLATDPDVKISLGESNAFVFDNSAAKETGTGYFKSVIGAGEVTPELGKIKVEVSNTPAGEKAQLSWGAVYWQYFENLDKITSAATPLSIKKTWYVERTSDRGPVLALVEDNTSLRPGDKLKVRLELRSDRAMEYIHVKDQRASGTEPVDVISGYHYQGGLGYYQSTRDASTNFFISYLPKGTYVFEYALFVNQQGNFSAGPAVAQCMYAPEFSAHSEGVRIKVQR